MSGQKKDVVAVLRGVPVIPVLIFDDVETAVPTAKALVAGGLPVLEITLRTPVARECVRRIIAEVPDATVGIGTVLKPKQLRQAEDDGVAFAVSPGATPRILDAADDCSVPLLPGIATVSEAMVLAERGYDMLKFFPAEAIGGAGALRSFASPLPMLRFCPTGGITLAKAPDYLKLPNVVCVGGSWMAPADLIKKGDWAGIQALAAEASGLKV